MNSRKWKDIVKGEVRISYSSNSSTLMAISLANCALPDRKRRQVERLADQMPTTPTFGIGPHFETFHSDLVLAKYPGQLGIIFAPAFTRAAAAAARPRRGKVVHDISDDARGDCKTRRLVGVRGVGGHKRTWVVKKESMCFDDPYRGRASR